MVGHKLTDEETGAVRHERLQHVLEGKAPADFELQLLDDKTRSLFRQARREKRDLSSLIGSAGGFVVPHGSLLTGIELGLDEFDPFRRAGATVHRSDSGTDQMIAFADDMSQEASISSDGQSPDDTDISFLGFNFHPQTFKTGSVVAPNELVEDSIGFTEAVGTALARRIARKQSNKVTADLAANLPSVAAAGTSAVVTDDILRLINGLGSGYIENSDSTLALMMAPSTALEMVRLKDGAGTYLIPQNGRPFNVRVIRNRWLTPYASLASGSVSVLAGLWSQLHVVDHRSFAFAVSTEARIEHYQTVFRGRLRARRMSFTRLTIRLPFAWCIRKGNPNEGTESQSAGGAWHLWACVWCGAF